jgi:arylsulfatase A-like enzyme
VGHVFGPYSQEVQDIILRLDRQLEALFQQLDQKIGLANLTIVLTADHGVAPTAEFASEQGLDGKRVDPLPLMGDLLAQLEARFGPGKYLLSQRIGDGNLYFNHNTLREKQIPAEDLAVFIREWALDTGSFQAAYSRSQLLDGRAPGTLGQRILNGYNAERSGDMVLVSKAFTLPSGVQSGTTHGTPYSYDTHVPVLLFGKAFKPGRCAASFPMTDLAPTLSVTLGMTEPSGCVGKPFTQVLKTQ